MGEGGRGAGDALTTLLTAAQARRDAGDWASALPLFEQAAARAPGEAAIRHNLAMCCHALGRHRAALSHAEAAVARAPRLWQSHALASRIHGALGQVEAADAALASVLAIDPGNAMALLDRAGLTLNAFADPAAARAMVAPLTGDPTHGGDTELATLMTLLYDRGEVSAAALNARLVAFSRRHLRLPRRTPRARGGGRLRIGMISPLFTTSPVFHLTWTTLAELARHHELVGFSRGVQADHATVRFRELAAEWHEVAALDAPALAARLAAADLDAILDLGGWSDPVGLRALSSHPAPAIYSWVGGQSTTTGLDGLAGWIGDAHHLPPGSEALYTEPLVRLDGGYIDYSPPPALETVRREAKARRGVGLVGNPAKVGADLMAAWPAGVERVTLIDRRYAQPRVRERVEALLAAHRIAVEAVIVPQGHDAYLRALAALEAIVVTRPYSAGLTAVEALALDVRLLAGGADGPLFCERHHLSHAASGGRNPAVPAQMRRLIERGAGLPCR